MTTVKDPLLVDVAGWDGTVDSGLWTFDERDLMLYALLTDPVYMPEILWKDPNNVKYGGCYRVRDYQYLLNRAGVIERLRTGLEASYAIFACARAVGKTESEKAHAEIHVVKEQGQNLLITAPELIHLLPLTNAIESHIRDIRLLRDFLDTRNGQTGFTHRPFGVKFLDGTELVGRIPQKTGVGVKGQHQPFLIVEEGQDYPEKGWVEVNETVNYDAVDASGRPAFRFWIYGVHSGDKASGFDERARSNHYHKVKITQLRRPDWNAQRKANAVASYGGSSSPDYRRNILGEPGAATSRYFVTARVMACVDQKARHGDQPGSDYNEHGYVHQKLRYEELQSLQIPVQDALDLPDGYKAVWGGADIGLTDSPTMISLFAETEIKRKKRLALVRRFELERFPTPMIRQAFYTIGWHFGGALLGMGIDMTGIGFPMFQEMEADEVAPQHFMSVTEGYMFNAKVPVGVDERDLTDSQGVKRDQFGNMVKHEVNETTGQERWIAMMPFIMASTRYVREDVDSGFLLLPFDTEVVSDMLAETKQRVETIGRRSDAATPKKGDRFHILDSFRAMEMRRHSDEIHAQLEEPEQQPVLDVAL